jgi:3-oxoacyl-[acyl-carrier protein] reductase
MRFKDQIVWVTGGSRGIGRALVESFAAEGARVLFTYSQAAGPASELATKLRDAGHQAAAYKLDVRDQKECDGFVEMIEAEHGRLDVLVNNAGIIRDGLLMAMESEDWQAVIDTNLTGLYHCIKPASRLMMRHRQGSIVNISSVAAARPGKGHCNYVASKGGVEAMTKALAVELAARKIRVNAVAPGVIETEMSEEVRRLGGDLILDRIPLKRFGQAADVAAAALFLASQEAAYVTGTILHVDGGAGI